jgi:hypothetical protein
MPLGNPHYPETLRVHCILTHAVRVLDRRSSNECTAMPRRSGHPVVEQFRRARDSIEAAFAEARHFGAPHDEELAEAKRRMAAARQRLTALARRHGLEPTNVGPLDKPEDRPPLGERPRRR